MNMAKEIAFKQETFRDSYTFSNSPEAVRRFPFPFAEDEYMYSVNIEQHSGGEPGSVFEHAIDVDEHYISCIYNGLIGEFSFAGKDYNLKITKVYTQVTNGRFQVDMEFVGEVPQGIRRGQTLQIRLALSDEITALLLPKGGFYQQTGGNWIFKVADNGKTAYKVDIQLGMQSPDYYQVLQGLKAGDKVVTSSYENYGNMQELVIKN